MFPCSLILTGHFTATVWQLRGVTALSLGLYKINGDVWAAAEAVDSRLAMLGQEAVGSQAALQKRVGALEGEVSKLKGALAAMQEQAKEAQAGK